MFSPLLACVLAFPCAVPARSQAGCVTPGVGVTSEDEDRIALAIDGDDVNADCVHPVLVGTDWVVDLTITTTDGLHDGLALSGTIRHLNAPHGEVPPPTGLQVSIAIDAGDYPGGTHVVPFRASVWHDGHLDELEGSVTIEVFFEAIFDFHFLFDWDVEMTALHVAAVPSLSPRWLAVLACGAAAALACVLRRCR